MIKERKPKDRDVVLVGHLCRVIYSNSFLKGEPTVQMLTYVGDVLIEIVQVILDSKGKGTRLLQDVVRSTKSQIAGDLRFEVKTVKEA